MPEEIVEGFSYRWAGEEDLPSRVVKHTFSDLMDRWVRRPDGPEAAKAWLFNLYFKRKAQSDQERANVRCDMLVIEGSEHLPYEQPMGETFQESFPNLKSFNYEQIQSAPFLLSVQRPMDVLKRVKKYVLSKPDVRNAAATAAAAGSGQAATKAAPMMQLSHAELYHLRQAFADLDYTQMSPVETSPVYSADGQETLVNGIDDNVDFGKIANLPVHRQVQNLRIA